MVNEMQNVDCLEIIQPSNPANNGHLNKETLRGYLAERWPLLTGLNGY